MMLRFLIASIIVGLALAVRPLGHAAAGSPATEDCPIRLADVRSPLLFSEFPAREPARVASAKLRIDSPDARLYRTRLRYALAHGPNFAGHYVLAAWACGALCTMFGIIDAKTGRVFFDPDLRDVSGDQVGDDPKDDPPSLRFRLDSRLLIVLGAPNEDESREGVSFYRWTGAKLALLRFVPQAKACSPAP
jgi:hypothetical protein